MISQLNGTTKKSCPKPPTSFPCCHHFMTSSSFISVSRSGFHQRKLQRRGESPSTRAQIAPHGAVVGMGDDPAPGDGDQSIIDFLSGAAMGPWGDHRGHRGQDGDQGPKDVGLMVASPKSNLFKGFLAIHQHSPMCLVSLAEKRKACGNGTSAKTSAIPWWTHANAQGLQRLS